MTKDGHLPPFETAEMPILTAAHLARGTTTTTLVVTTTATTIPVATTTNPANLPMEIAKILTKPVKIPEIAVTSTPKIPKTGIEHPIEFKPTQIAVNPNPQTTARI